MINAKDFDIMKWSCTRYSCRVFGAAVAGTRVVSSVRPLRALEDTFFGSAAGSIEGTSFKSDSALEKLLYGNSGRIVLRELFESAGSIEGTTPVFSKRFSASKSSYTELLDAHVFADCRYGGLTWRPQCIVEEGQSYTNFMITKQEIEGGRYWHASRLCSEKRRTYHGS